MFRRVPNASFPGTDFSFESESESPEPFLQRFAIDDSNSQSRKRPAEGELSPVNHRRTNVFVAAISNPTGISTGIPITPNDSFQFPQGLYTRSYHEGHRKEHFVRSAVDWRWKEKDGQQLDRQLFKAINDDYYKR
jgi:hypothetical protein